MRIEVAGARISVLLLLLVGVLPAGDSYAQPALDGYHVDRWTTADGLPVNGLTDILQTRDGYLWIATWDGLVRFDGLRFTVYTRSNSPGLPGNRLAQLFETDDGILWVRTEHHQLAALRDGVLEEVDATEGLIGREVRQLLADRDGSLLVGTNVGVFAWNGSRFEERWRKTGPELSSLSIASVLIARDSTLWIGTYDEGVIAVRGGTATAIRTYGGSRLTSVLALAEDDRGRIWVEAYPWQANREQGAVQGLFVVEGNELRRLDLGTPERVGADLVGTEVVRRGPDPAIFRTSGRLVSAVPEDAEEPWKWRLLPETPRSGPGPRSYTGWDFVYREDGFVLKLPIHPYGVLWDEDGSLWLATNGEGLWRYRSIPFRTLGLAEGLPFENVYPILVDRQNRIWTAALGQEGLFVVDPDEPATAERFLEEAAVLALYEDRQGSVWVGTNAGVCRFEPAVTPGRCAPLTPPGGDSGPVYAIFEDSEGVIWMADDRRLLRWWRGGWIDGSGGIPAGPAALRAVPSHKDSSTPVRRVRQALPEQRRFRAITEDARGNLWFGAALGGVSILLRNNGSSVLQLTTADGLPSNAVRDLVPESNGAVWVVTEDAGLARVVLGDAGAPPEVVAVTQRDGLPEEALHTMQADDLGNWWVSSNRGLFTLDRAQLDAWADGAGEGFRATLYTERDGLRNKEFNGGYFRAGSKGPDGRLWFSGQAGVVGVDPARAPRRSPPDVVIEAVTSSGVSRSVRGSVELAPRDRTFEVSYTALAFVVPEETRFRTRMTGYDDGWMDVDTRRTAYYTQVPPGSYVFGVSASGRDGTWGEPVEMLVTVRPFFHETVWFLALCAAALVVAVTAGFRWLVSKLRARQRELEAVVERRTRQIGEEKRRTEEALNLVEAQAEQLRSLDAAKSRFFANISHEFRTPLTLILGPVGELMESRETPTGHRLTLERVRRNAYRLLYLINQLLDLARLDAGGLALRSRREDLVALVAQTVSLFESVARVREVELVFSSDQPELEIAVDAEKIEKVVMNLLSNAIKYTDKGGRVAVSVNGSEGGSASIRVSDTGAGIPAEYLDRVFDRFFQVSGPRTRGQEGSGIGLALARELVELHGGTLQVESQVGAGSNFLAVLPDRPATEVNGEHVATSGSDILPSAGIDADSEPSLSGDSVPAPPDGPVSKPVLLVVEDNADLRRYLRSQLEEAFVVIEASDGSDGLERAVTSIPDIVLSDVMMGGMDGLELCRALKRDERTSHMPVVLLTARGDVESRLDGLETGADDYLAKPFEPRELLARLRNLVDQRRMLRARFSQSVFLLGADEVMLPPREVGFLERVKAVVQERMGDAGFGVDELCDQIGMSRSQVERKLSALVGESPGMLIRRLRLERAAQLLRRGEPVKAVAGAVGFRSRQHFSDAFRQTFGVSPSEVAEEE